MRLFVGSNRRRDRCPATAGRGWQINAVLCLIVLSAACRTTRPKPSQGAPDPRVLSGRWNLELGDRYLFPVGPAVLGGRPDPFMVGELRLDSVVVPIVQEGSSVSGIKGEFIRALADGEEPPPLKYPATAAFRPDGQVIVTLTFPTTCPCPVHELVGALESGEIRGRSSLATPDHTFRGRFILRRDGGT